MGSSAIRRGALVLWLGLLVACGGTRTTYDGLYVEVSAPAGMALDQVRLWVLKAGDGIREVTPRDPDQMPSYLFDVSRRDLAAEPFLAKLVPGTRFTGAVRIVVVGDRAQVPVARAVVDATLEDRGAVRAVLVEIGTDCDGDRDGFPDCRRAGCCPAGDGLGDCNDADPLATPVGFEDECTRCGFPGGDGGLQDDSSDDDCDGTPATCRDADGDASGDCRPTWCDAESQGSPRCQDATRDADCDAANDRVYPGALEACDGQDNDCNGQTDENAATTTVADWDGEVRKLGDLCGTGRCAGGKVECGPEGRARCSTEGMKAAQEDCAKRDDANCNGDTADGCTGGDLDGDGLTDALEIQHCPSNPLAKFHSEVFPELGAGFPKHPFPEPCCDLSRHPGEGDAPPACDWDCNGAVIACVANDADRDGFPAGADTDCDDTNPAVHAGAWEKCDDGLDQDCSGSDLKCTGGVDADDDGFLKDEGDCDDGDPAVSPWASEACNARDDDCDGLTDEGNPGGEDAPCGTDEGECVRGVSACVRDDGTAAVECRDPVVASDEVCDGRDNDCDGGTDEAFRYDPSTGRPCGEDDRGCAVAPAVGQACRGIGECGAGEGEAGLGVVECLDGATAACSTNPDGKQPRDRKEICNNLDDDCDGAVDDGVTSWEDSTCLKTGVCLDGNTHVVARCAAGEWSCDYGAVPGWENAEHTCDDRDNDCDGGTDEGFVYFDEVHPDPVPKGAGCGTGACANGTVVCLADGTDLFCDTSVQITSEVCDGLDDDCNGQTDEGFLYQGIPVWVDASDSGKGRSACPGIGECPEGRVECRTLVQAQCSTNPGGSEYVLRAETCDGRDNDCNGSTDEVFTLADWNGAIRVKGDGCGTGRCAGGSVECRGDGTGVECTTAGLSRAEVCDNLDDDCNGRTDEDQAWNGIGVWVDPADPSKGHRACTGIGECGRAAGVVECRLATGKAVCSTNPDGTTPEDRPEVCNGLDDDCDGLTDEDQSWNGIAVWKDPADPSKGHPACTGIGECGQSAGFVECNPLTGAATCSTNADGSQHRDVPETCNARDDDCDGRTDEDQAWNGTGVWVDPADTTKGRNPCTGTGECGNFAGLVECHATTLKAVCSTNPDGSGRRDVAEACNGKDDDCDGTVDDGLGILSADTTCLRVGVCDPAKVVARCIEAAWVCDYTKVATYQPGQERSCDALDNDCDGATDEDFTLTDWNGAVRTKGAACGTGLCATGTVVCKGDGTGLICSTAGNAAPEACDGQDNDCNGTVDEGTDGLCHEAPDVTCTTDACAGGGCKHTIVGGFCLIDGVCYSAGAARPGKACQYCNVATPTAWTHRTNGTSCDADDNGCTVGDSCQAGECTPGAVRDCTALNGPCKEGRCVRIDATTSTCNEAAIKPGEPCNDQDPCTQADKCTGGSCVGTGYSCDDGKTCTTNVCDGNGGCLFPVVDGFCLVGGLCRTGGQQDPDNDCRQCVPTSSKTAWTWRPNGDACDDLNPCTTTDTCQSGDCAGGPTLNCNDDDSCTADTCNPAAPNAGAACVHTPVPGTACADGDSCTYNDVCLAGGGCAGTRKDCVPAAACLESACNGIGGCTETVKAGQCFIDGLCWASGQNAAGNTCKVCDPANPRAWTSLNGDPCTDLNRCTVGDRCVAGTCTPTGMRDCNDANPCTDDSCNVATGDAITGCLLVPNTAVCSDGNLCTINESCSGGTCGGGSPKCTGATPNCNPSTGACS